MADLTDSALHGPAGRREPGDVLAGLAFLLATVARYGGRRLATYWSSPARQRGQGRRRLDQRLRRRLHRRRRQGRPPARGQLRHRARRPSIDVRRPQADHARRVSVIDRQLLPAGGVRRGPAPGRSSRRRRAPSSTSCCRRTFQADMPLSMFVLPGRDGDRAARRCSASGPCSRRTRCPCRPADIAEEPRAVGRRSGRRWCCTDRAGPTVAAPARRRARPLRRARPGTDVGAGAGPGGVPRGVLRVAGGHDPRPRAVGRRADAPHRPVHVAGRLVHARGRPSVDRADARRSALPAAYVAQPATPSPAGACCSRWSRCRSCCRRWWSGRRSGRCCRRPGSGRSARSSSPTCSSTSPSWCGWSAGCGAAGPAYDAAARTLGASPWRAFRTVDLAAAAAGGGRPRPSWCSCSRSPRSASCSCSAARHEHPGGRGLPADRAAARPARRRRARRPAAGAARRRAAGQRARAGDERGRAGAARAGGDGRRAGRARPASACCWPACSPWSWCCSSSRWRRWSWRSLRVRGGWGLTWWRALGSVDAGTTGSVAPWASVGVSLRYAVVTSVLAVVVGGLAACAIAYAGRRGRVAGRARDAAAGDVGGHRRLRHAARVLAPAAGPARSRGGWCRSRTRWSRCRWCCAPSLPVLRSVDPRLRQVAGDARGAAGAGLAVGRPAAARAGARGRCRVRVRRVARGVRRDRLPGPHRDAHAAGADRPPARPARRGQRTARRWHCATVLMLVTVAALLVTELVQPAARRAGR